MKMSCHKCHRKKLKCLEKYALYKLATTNFEYRDDSPNNKDHPEWGEAGQQLLRKAEPQYADGISQPAGENRKSAREISNVVFSNNEPHPNPAGASAMFTTWGQWLDHDLSLSGEADPHESFPIIVPTGDPWFDPDGTGTKTIPLSRSIWDNSTGTGTDNPREQLQQITSFIDGSNVYGSAGKRLNWLRYGKYGLLKTSSGDMLPYNDKSMSNAMGKSPAFYVGGDVRCNENHALIAMHTVWMREHNYWARKLHEFDKCMGDDELFQRARVMVEAELQAITINEFLPLLLGKKGYFQPYSGYDPTANPGIMNEFSTAAYRLGHTLVSPTLLRLDNDGKPIHENNIQIKDAYFNPWIMTTEGGIDPILRGLAVAPAQALDHTVIDDLRNFLFGQPGEGGLDLVSLNIQRGRDHGLADYNTTREAYGLDKISDFDEIISDVDLQTKLADLYDHNVDNIDLYVALQCEDKVDGSQLGPLLTAIVGEQAVRMRAGDRFWYQHRLPKKILRYIEHVKLSDVILRNTDICKMPLECMKTPK